jgi:uncharacterized protein (DUF2267 family)
MPMPLELQRSSEEFESFLACARDELGLATRNQTYTSVQAVLKAFRDRLDLADAIRFAQVLPPVVRAIFVADWDPAVPKRPFGTADDWLADVRALRKDHNFSPDTAIRDVAVALTRHVDRTGWETMLAALPADARRFWAVGPPQRPEDAARDE